MHRRGAESAPHSAPLIWLALAYTVFVVYGSLVPLDFRPRPWAEAIQMFRHIRYLQLGIGSRADWVSNILLFIPLSFLWTGAWWSRRHLWWNLLAAPLVLAAAASLSVAIEFTQLFFPPRTVSINDLFAESIGAVLGILVWWVAGPKILNWARSWRADSEPASVWIRLLVAYLALLIGYSLLPLDITISPVEVFHKWRNGRVVLVPFSFLFKAPIDALYGLTTDVLIWIPVGALWCLGSRRPRVKVWMAATLVAIALEVLQLGIYSRVSDITDIFTASLGVACGILAVTRRFSEPAPGASHSEVRGIAWLPLLFAGVWCGGLITLFWYPFEFTADRATLVERVNNLTQAPFTAYYYGTEFRAITEVFHKVGLFIPLGILLGIAVSPIQSPRWRGFVRFCAVGFIAFFALGIEAGQLLLPDKNADLTDLALEIIGGWGGFFGLSRLLARQRRQRDRLRRPSRHLRQPR